MAKKQINSSSLELREFRSTTELDLAITKLQRRVKEIEQLDVRSAVLKHTGADDVAESNVRNSILEVFGQNSPEFHEHEYVRIWEGPEFLEMEESNLIDGKERGRTYIVAILNGLIMRLQEKKEELTMGASPAPATYFHSINLHPRINEVSRGLFLDGYHWDAVFAAAKALLNYIKERSNFHNLDGTSLVRKVFSKNGPILAFNALQTQTDLDEQEGMMHLFEGAVLGIRNPGGHSFPEGTAQRAIEYISFLSLLAYRVQEAEFKKSP